MSLQDRLNRWFLFFVIFPLVLFLTCGNAILWRELNRRHHAFLEDISRKAAADFSEELNSHAQRLRDLAPVPDFQQVLKQEKPPGKITAIERKWGHLEDNDPLVRQTLDNPTAGMFRNLCDAEDKLARLILIDRDGVIRAASEKTEYFDFTQSVWWKSARPIEPDVILSDGVSAQGYLGLSIAVVDKNNPSTILGVLRAEVDVDNVLAEIGPAWAKGEWATMLVERRARFIKGGRWLFERLSANMEDLEPKLADGTGWVAGVRFRSIQIGEGIRWVRPLWIMSVRPDWILPKDVYAPLAVTVGVSLLIVVGVLMASRRKLKKVFFEPLLELMEAGDWVLRNALGRDPALEAKGKKGGTGILDAVKIEPGPTQKTLEEWFYRFKQDLDDEIAFRTAEMQRDLELARDFQRAHLDRPYPKVPSVHIEGRLRLEFYHCYLPALALGGDFFDIVAYAPDAAGVFIADVMGHGTRSALITSILRTVIGDLAPQGRNARHFLSEMNNQFCHILRTVPHPLFASAFYFVADTTARVGTYSSAGHPSPFHVRRSVGRVGRVPVPEPKGAALGLIPHETYTGGHCRLTPGDVFLFFTDGLYEAHNRDGEDFGIERMHATIKASMYKGVRQMVDDLIVAVNEFVGDQPLADDICVVGVEVTTAAAAGTEPGV